MTQHKGGDSSHIHNHLPEFDEKLSNDDERTVLVLHKALENLDSHIPLLTPSSDWFQQQIRIRQAQNRKRLIRELLVFVLVAVVILSALISVALQRPSVFLIMQLTSLVIAPIVLLLLIRNQVGA